MKRNLIIIISTLCMCINLTVSAYASTPQETNNLNVNNNPEVYNDPLYNTKDTIINSEIFIPNESGVLNPISEYDSKAVVPSYYGQVKIDSSTSGDSGITDTDKKTGSWSTIKYASLKVLPYIPIVGQLTSNAVDIYDGIKAVYSDIRNFDTGKTTGVYTRYVYRYHYLNGYVWDYADYWKFYAKSTSKAYYKVQTFDCIVNNDFVSRTRPYTAGNGYSPTAIQKATHYNNTTGLANICYERWSYGLSPYYETY